MTVSLSGAELGTSGSCSCTVTGIFVVAGDDELNLPLVIGPANVPPVSVVSTVYDAPLVGGVLTDTPFCTVVCAHGSLWNDASADFSLRSSTTCPEASAISTP